MTIITTILRPSMLIRRNYSLPTPTLSHMKLRQRIFTKISIPTLRHGLTPSDYPTNHPSGIKTELNSKVLEMFKDEAGGKQIVDLLV